MFITLTNIQSGVPVKLAIPIDNRCQHKTVALHEVFYKVSWTNIDSSNNWIKKYDPSTRAFNKFTVQEGYYDFCTLEKELFRPAGITAKLNQASLIVTLQTSSFISMPERLAEKLGFEPLFRSDYYDGPEVEFGAFDDVGEDKNLCR